MPRSLDALERAVIVPQDETENCWKMNKAAAIERQFLEKTKKKRKQMIKNKNKNSKKVNNHKEEDIDIDIRLNKKSSVVVNENVNRNRNENGDGNDRIIVAFIRSMVEQVVECLLKHFYHLHFILEVKKEYYY